MTVAHSINENCNELWHEVRRGSKPAFEKLYGRLIISLSEYALRILKDEHVVKDIMQDLFVSVYLRRHEIAADINIVGYLHNAVKYQAAHVLRTRAKSRTVALVNEDLNDLPYGGAGQILGEEMRDDLQLNIQSLPDRSRKAFLLNYRDELSYKQIASHMKISIKTVEKHIGRALKILRNGRWTNYG